MDLKKHKSLDCPPLVEELLEGKRCCRNRHHVVLIGHPRCGKSYFAQRLSSFWQIPWIDTDRLIEEEYSIATGQRVSCSEIFQKIGNQAFREREREAIGSISPSIPLIAAGGGAVLEEKTVALLQEKGLLVFLLLPEQAWKERISFLGLPMSLSPASSLEALYRERNLIYESVADVKIVLEEKNDTQVLQEIAQIGGWS